MTMYNTFCEKRLFTYIFMRMLLIFQILATYFFETASFLLSFSDWIYSLPYLCPSYFSFGSILTKNAAK